MKSLRLLFVPGLLLFTAFTPGNNCESYFPQKVGTKWEMTSYDEKDKVVSISASELKDVTDIPEGLQATVHVDAKDAKGKSMSAGDVIMKCEGDKFLMDMSNMFPKGQMEGIDGAEVEMTNEYMEFPSNPTAGQVLPDASSTMTVKVNGMTMMTMTMNTTNRKIEGFEDVTTPAGTYHCMKYTSDLEMNSMMMKQKNHSAMWMAKGVGSVKMESYDDKGKLQSKMLLTKFSE